MRTLLALAGCCLVSLRVASAQEPARPVAGAPQVSADTREEDEETEEPAPFEGEFIASTIFQSATAAFRLGSPLLLETHYFGVEDNDVGAVGLAWEFEHGGLHVMPGLAWSFSSEGRPAPVVTVRWTYEGHRWLTQGLWVQSLRAYVPAEPHDEGHPGEESGEDVVHHASILDGVHASLVLGHLELGPLVEHIRYREENAWKGGVRAAWRLGRGVKLVSQVVGPGAELRGGLAWEP